MCETKVAKQIERKKKKQEKDKHQEPVSTNQMLCNEVLRSGKRKGQICNCKVKSGFSKCGRHIPK